MATLDNKVAGGGRRGGGGEGDELSDGEAAAELAAAAEEMDTVNSEFGHKMSLDMDMGMMARQFTPESTPR